MKPAHLLLVVAIMLTWGLNFAAAKISLDVFPPFLMTAIRFGIVGLLLVPFFRPQRAQLLPMLWISFLMGTLHFGLLFAGLAGMDSATAAILIQLEVPISTVFAFLFFQDKIGWRRASGMSLAFVGAIILAGEPQHAGIGSVLLVLAAATAWPLGNVFIKRLGEVHPVMLNGWTALFAAPQLLLFSLIFEQDQIQAIQSAELLHWSTLSYTIIGSSLFAYTAWYWLLKKYSLNTLVPFTFVGPVIAVSAGILLLGESLTIHKIAGGALTLAGVAWVQYRELVRRKAKISVVDEAAPEIAAR